MNGAWEWKQAQREQQEDGIEEDILYECACSFCIVLVPLLRMVCFCLLPVSNVGQRKATHSLSAQWGERGTRHKTGISHHREAYTVGQTEPCTVCSVTHSGVVSDPHTISLPHSAQKSSTRHSACRRHLIHPTLCLIFNYYGLRIRASGRLSECSRSGEWHYHCIRHRHHRKEGNGHWRTQPPGTRKQ